MIPDIPYYVGKVKLNQAGIDSRQYAHLPELNDWIWATEEMDESYFVPIRNCLRRVDKRHCSSIAYADAAFFEELKRQHPHLNENEYFNQWSRKSD